MTELFASLGLGFLFGWSLNRAGLTHYARIVNVYRFTDMTVMRFMLTALVVGGVLIQLGLDLGWTRGVPLPPTIPAANLLGGVIFGVGMASAGYCPGTIVAEAAEGRWDAWLAGGVGLLVGAIAFGLAQPHLMPALTKLGTLGRVSFAALLGANPWLVLLLFTELVALVLVLIAPRRQA